MNEAYSSARRSHEEPNQDLDPGPRLTPEQVLLALEAKDPAIWPLSAAHS